MYRCEHFKIYELVPREYYEGYSEHKLWLLFDDRALKTLDALRNQYGRITINTWKSGGQYNESGLRSAGTETGAVFSQHKFGRAFDAKFKDAPVGVVRKDCIDKRYDCFLLVSAIELGVKWFHFDTRNNVGDLITFEKGA